MGYAFPGTSASATAKVGAAVGRRERGLVGIAAAKAIRAVADGGAAELAVLTPAEAIDDYSKVALRRHFEIGILFTFSQLFE